MKQTQQYYKTKQTIMDSPSKKYPTTEMVAVFGALFHLRHVVFSPRISPSKAIPSSRLKLTFPTK